MLNIINRSRLNSTFIQKWILLIVNITNYQKCLIGIVVLAFLLRVLHVLAINYAPVSDMEAYLKHAELLISPGPDTIYTTLFPPGYIWFLLAVKMVSNLATPLPILVLQAIIDTVTLVFVAKIARSLYNSKTAIVASSIFALYKPALLCTGVVMSETLSQFGIVCSFLSFLCYLRSRSLWRLLACVCITSLAVQIRVNTLVIVGIYIIYILFLRVGGLRFAKIAFLDRLRHCTIFLLILLASLVPWSIRNSRVLGRPAFISVNGDLNLFQGNHAYTEGGWYDGPIPNAEYELASQMPFEKRLPELGRLARKFIVQHPLYELFYLVPQRFYYIYLAPQTFWPWEQAIESNYASDPFGPWIKIPLISMTPIFVLGLLGFCVREKRGYSFIVPALWLALLGPLLAVHGNNRFHYISDFLLILSSSSLIEVFLRQGKFRFAIQMGWTIFILATVVLTIAQFLRFGSPNLLILHTTSTVGQDAIQNEAIIDTSLNGSKYTVPIAEMTINARKSSHLLLSADLKMQTDSLGVTPDIQLTFYDDQNSTVTSPRHAETLLPNRVLLNPQPAGFQHMWRIILIPASATRMELKFIQPFPAVTHMKNLSLRGSIWEK